MNGGTGTAPATQTVDANGKATVPTSTSFSKTNYTFSGWGANSSVVSAIDLAATPIVANTTFYAVWTILPFTYTPNSSTALLSASLTYSAIPVWNATATVGTYSVTKVTYATSATATPSTISNTYPGYTMFNLSTSKPGQLIWWPASGGAPMSRGVYVVTVVNSAAPDSPINYTVTID